MDGNRYADRYLYDLNPFEWAGVFSYGSFLVTDYFHGTILGLKNGIPVLSIDSSKYGTSGEYESKACDLLRTRLNMPQMYVPAETLQGENGFEEFSDRIRRIEESFNAAALAERIEKEKESCRGFLDALGKILNNDSDGDGQ